MKRLVRLPHVALLIVCLAIALLAASGCGEPAAPEETLDRPVVTGGTISGEQDGGMRKYLGIPYAAPPVGERRWQPPQPVEPWSGVRACTAYGPSCPQEGIPLGPFGVGRTSEDCLYLNVWTPAATPDDRLPVMVWIHGGSFVSGSGSLPLYAGDRLAAAGDVVVVTINYRLGPFGFLAHPALSAESAEGSSGNYGLLDQVAALDWVQDNAEAFGGDPGRVTVFGESAGAISILDLMASPLAEGSFQRAIVQSGILWENGLGSMTGTTLAEAERAGVAFGRRLGVPPDSNDAATLEALRAVPAPDLLAEAGRGVDFLTEGLAFKPVVDGYVLPRSATSVFEAGEQMDVPLLIGSNADEGELFLAQMRPLTPAQYRAYVRATFGEYADDVLALYPASTSNEVRRAMSRMLTEMGFASSARFAAAAVAEGGQARAFLYQFTRVPPLAGEQFGLPKGAFHGLEIPYVFGQAELFGVNDPVDLRLSEAMMGMWTRFAATGDPNEAGDALWPPYSPDDDRHLELGDRIIPGAGLYTEACDLADEIRATE